MGKGTGPVGTLWRVGVLCAVACAGACRSMAPQEPKVPPLPTAFHSLVPRPASLQAGAGSFELTPEVRIAVEPASEEVQAIARFLAERLSGATGYRVPVVAGGPGQDQGVLLLTTAGADPGLGEEGYELEVTRERVSVVALRPAGLFRGVQTIRQLLPASIESATARPGPWELPAVTIVDRPRFAWRGAMLDVARHFFGVADVQRFVDLAVYYKMNRLHLHLSDDQGWRIVVDSWPRLATVGGTTQVGGGPPGAYYYTKGEYSEIVRYAHARYVTIVPEIDMPGHTNAALASYAELNCDGVARPPYTGIEVGFSSLCLGKEVTTTFVKDVVRELSALTPGPYFHMGGDEASSTDPAEYLRFVEDVQSIIGSQGKRMVGWEEVAKARLAPASIVQQWDRGLAAQAVAQGAKLILSPSKKAYLDMKYDAGTPLGQDWAGFIEVKDAYDWDPATYVQGVSEADVLGVEAPLWTETLATLSDLEYMTLPRLAGIAEIGWSPGPRSWDEYRQRLATHGPRWKAMGVNFYRSPQVAWVE